MHNIFDTRMQIQPGKVYLHAMDWTWHQLDAPALTWYKLELDELLRLRYNLLLTYKIVFGLIDEAANNMFTLTSSLHSVNTRGHVYDFYPHNSRIDIRKYFFSERVVAPWNNLPATHEHFRSLSSLLLNVSLTQLIDLCTSRLVLHFNRLL